MFTVVESNAIRVTYLDSGIPHVSLSNRHFTSNFFRVNDEISLTSEQMPNITFAMPMNQINNCRQFVLQIMRAGGVGTTTAIMSDFIVKRDTAGGTATGPGILANGEQTGSAGTYPLGRTCPLACPSCCPTPQPPQEELGNQGCTPGYWKNHTDSWAGTSYVHTQRTDSVFDVPFSSLASRSLLQSLQGGGGSGLSGAAEILLRAAVAALLNASNPSVDYPRTTAQVIASVNTALASNNRNVMLRLAEELDRDNNLGCPLN